MQEISIYINAKSSTSDRFDWQKGLEEVLFRSQLNFRSPTTIAELEEGLESDARSGVDSIISIGGDGTVNTMIQKLAGTNLNLYVAPGGTANDLASELNSKRVMKELSHVVRAKNTKKMDLININGRYMATNGGIGFAANVAEKINDLRKKFPAFKRLMGVTGRAIYPFMAASEFLSINYKIYEFYIESEQFTGKVRSPLIMVNNQKTIGQTFEVAPQTKNDDGSFNVTILTHNNRAKLANCMIRLASGADPALDPNIITFETKKMNITNLTDEKLSFFGDGEVFDNEKNTSHFEISVLEKGLNVFYNDLDPYAQGMEVHLS